MGYRSQVAIKCEDGAYNKIMDTIHKFDGAIIPDKDYMTDDNLHFLYWDWVKWYEESYDEVSAIMNVLSELDDMAYDNDTSEGIGYAYLRLGEDMSDVDEKNNTSGLIWVDYIHKIDMPMEK